jgi:transposase-like protein
MTCSKQLTKMLVERVLETEMTEHLGYGKRRFGELLPLDIHRGWWRQNIMINSQALKPRQLHSYN